MTPQHFFRLFISDSIVLPFNACHDVLTPHTWPLASGLEPSCLPEDPYKLSQVKSFPLFSCLMLMSETFGNLLVLILVFFFVRGGEPKWRWCCWDVLLEKSVLHGHCWLLLDSGCWWAVCHCSCCYCYCYSCCVWHWCFMVSFLCIFVWLTNFKRSPSSNKHHHQTAAQFQKAIQLFAVDVDVDVRTYLLWTNILCPKGYHGHGLQ